VRLLTAVLLPAARYVQADNESDTARLRLRVLLQAMPKGGDLHNHLSVDPIEAKKPKCNGSLSTS
jgi:hypothetical protein